MNRRDFVKASSVSTTSILASGKWPLFQKEHIKILNPRHRAWLDKTVAVAQDGDFSFYV